MQIPGIRNFVTSPIDYFLESSWQGKTVQVLCVASILTMIYFAFRKKTPTQGPGTPPTTLSGRAQTQPQVKTTLKRSNAPKRSGASSTTLPNRMQTQPPVQSKELPKADRSYIKKTQVDPDFLKFPESEFGIWLSCQR